MISNDSIGSSVSANTSNPSGKPVGGGKKSPFSPRVEYCNSDYCLSCAYFEQTKGHFGNCKVKPSVKNYDGTKKGMSCSLYRINPKFIDIINEAKIKEKQMREIPRISKFKILREGYNEYAKKRSHYKRLEKHGEYDWKSETSKKEYCYGLPYSLTSDLKQLHKGYYSHKHHFQIIDYAVTLAEKEYNFTDISEKITSMFGVKVTEKTIYNWCKKFSYLFFHEEQKNNYRLEKRFGLFWHKVSNSLDITIPQRNNCPRCGSFSFKKNGIRYGNVPAQKYICNDCNKKFCNKIDKYLNMKFDASMIEKALELSKCGLSSRQISYSLNRHYGVYVSAPTVSKWVKKHLPNSTRLRNGAHRKEVNNAISRGMKSYCSMIARITPSKETKQKIFDLWNDGLSFRQISKIVKNECPSLTVKRTFLIIKNELCLNVEYRNTTWHKTKNDFPMEVTV